jgi:cell division protease FtsH
VMQEDFEIAKDKVLMGTERKSLIISDSEKKATAYHEAGHALVAYMLPEADPLHKVTIIPRGRALGVTQQLPVDDKHTYSREYLDAALTVMMGGRVSEELQLGKMTTGAGNDIERATDLARKMVCEWGMSDKMGPLTFGKKEEAIFLGREIAQHRDYSEATAIDIDREVKEIVLAAYQEARRILEEHSAALVRIAEALLDYEVLDAEQIAALVKGESMPLRQPSPSAPATGTPEAEAGRERVGEGRPGVLPTPGSQPA